MKSNLNQEERLRLLIEAAEDIFLEVGYEAASLDEVIARAGGSRRNIYDHYRGKEGLFIEVIGGLTRKYESPFETMDLSGLSADEALTRFAKQLLESVLASEALRIQRLMVAESNRFPELAQVIWEHGQYRVEVILAKLFLALQKAGEIRAEVSCEDLSRWFVGALTSSATIRKLVHDGTEKESTRMPSPNEAKLFVSVFLRGLAPPHNKAEKP